MLPAKFSVSQALEQKGQQPEQGTGASGPLGVHICRHEGRCSGTNIAVRGNSGAWLTAQVKWVRAGPGIPKWPCVHWTIEIDGHTIVSNFFKNEKVNTGLHILW